MAFTKLALILLVASAAGSYGAVNTPLCGFYQGFDLSVAPPGGPGGNGQPQAACYVQGVPTKTGFSPLAEGPVAMDVPQGTGNHTVRFVVPDGYTLVNALLSSPRPADSLYSLTIDTSTASLNFNANIGSPGDAGTGTFLLMKGATQLCQTSVSFKLLPANDQACAIATSGSSGGSGGSPAAPATPQADSPTVYFPATNVVVVNPAAPPASVQPLIQVIETTYGGSISPTPAVAYSQVSCACCSVQCTFIVSVGGTTYNYPPAAALPPVTAAAALSPASRVAPSLAPSSLAPSSLAPSNLAPALGPNSIPATAVPASAPVAAATALTPNAAMGPATKAPVMIIATAPSAGIANAPSAGAAIASAPTGAMTTAAAMAPMTRDPVATAMPPTTAAAATTTTAAALPPTAVRATSTAPAAAVAVAPAAAAVKPPSPPSMPPAGAAAAAAVPPSAKPPTGRRLAAWSP